jgi:Protein of unknown function (DUF3352)
MSDIEPNELNPQPPAAAPSPAETPTVAWTPPRDETVAALSSPLAPAAPMGPPSAPARRASRVRWLVAGPVTVLVVGVTAAATLLITGQSPASSLVGYVDKTSFFYTEARLDLPGDQRPKLGQFLSKFPGFDDQSILDRKLDEALDKLIGKATDAKQDWSTKIKPWFGGEIAAAAELPEVPADGAPPQFHGLIVVKVRDGGAAISWLKSAIGDTPTATQSQGDTELLIIGSGRQKAAVAIGDGKAMLIGDEASVRKAIDSHGSGTFAQSDAYKQARAAFDQDALAFTVVDLISYTDFITRLSPGSAATQTPLPPALKAMLPQWIAMELRAEGDAIVMDAVAPHIAAMDVGDNRVSDILPHLPASTIVVVEGHDLGATLKKVLDAYRQTPGLDEPMKQLDTALGLVGGFDGTFGWMRDGAVVITRNGSSVDGGLVVTPSDPAAAQRLFTGLRSLVVLGGVQAGFKVSDETYNGATITTIDFGDFRDLMNSAGAGGAIAPTLPEGRAKLVYTSTDKLVVVGLDDTFVKAVLDTQAGASLATDGRFKAATDRAGTSNRGLAYVDVAAVRELFESLAPDSSMRATYERDYKPYLVPLNAFVLSNREDGTLDRGGEWLVVGN